jgi:hypothetical protein
MCHQRWLVLGLVLVFAGCGEGRDPNLPPLVPVTGTVKLDGKPVSGAFVTFIPTQGTIGTGSTGITDAEGKYELATMHDGTGAPVGSYQVVISKLVRLDGTDFPAGEEFDAMGTPHKNLFPPQYSDQSQTTLKANVPEGGKAIDIDLKSK